MIRCVASRLPPGVLSSTTTAGGAVAAGLADAVLEVAGHDLSTTPVVGSTTTSAASAARAGLAGAEREASARARGHERQDRRTRRARRRMVESVTPSMAPCAAILSPAPASSSSAERRRGRARSRSPCRSTTRRDLRRRGERAAQLVRLADGHRPAGGVGHVDDAEVDGADRRRVVVEQPDEAELGHEVGLDLLGPLAAQAAGEVAVARVRGGRRRRSTSGRGAARRRRPACAASGRRGRRRAGRGTGSTCLQAGRASIAAARLEAAARAAIAARWRLDAVAADAVPAAGRPGPVARRRRGPAPRLTHALLAGERGPRASARAQRGLVGRGRRRPTASSESSRHSSSRRGSSPQRRRPAGRRSWPAMPAPIAGVAARQARRVAQPRPRAPPPRPAGDRLARPTGHRLDEGAATTSGRWLMAATAASCSAAVMRTGRRRRRAPARSTTRPRHRRRRPPAARRPTAGRGRGRRRRPRTRSSRGRHRVAADEAQAEARPRADEQPFGAGDVA